MPALRKNNVDWHDHISPVPWSGCWLWDGSTQKGYGFHYVKGKKRSVHRLAWEETNGPIPEGLFVCHHCDVKLCCNPDHLFLGTNSDNLRDMYAKGIGYQQQITHCPNGHEYTLENTYFNKKGDNRTPARYCRTCHLARLKVSNAAYYARNLAMVRKKAREYQRKRRALLKCQE